MRGVLLVGLVTAALGCGRFGFDALPSGDGGGNGDAPGDGTVPVANCVPTQPSGPVIHVDAVTGSDSNPGSPTQPMRTIQHAVLQLPVSGGTVVVSPGDYMTEPNNEVNTDGNDIRIIATPHYRARITRFECFDCRRVLLEGFEITGGGVCAQVSSGADMTFRDNIIHGCTSAAVRIAGSVTGAVVTSNVIYDSRNALVHVNDDSQADIVDNVLFDTAPQGDFPMVWMEGTINTRVARNVVFEGRHQITGYGAISIGIAANLMIENNIIGPNAPAFTTDGAIGLDSASGSATIRFNTFVGPFSGSVFGLGRYTGTTVASSFVVTHNVWVSVPQTAQPFSDAATNGSDGFTLDRNDYWNDGAAFSQPTGKLGPTADTRMITVDPQVSGAAPTVLPAWNASTMTFGASATTTCEVHTAMIDTIGKLPPTSPVVGRGMITPPATDIRGTMRPTPATLGAYEP